MRREIAQEEMRRAKPQRAKTATSRKHCRSFLPEVMSTRGGKYWSDGYFRSQEIRRQTEDQPPDFQNFHHENSPTLTKTEDRRWLLSWEPGMCNRMRASINRTERTQKGGWMPFVLQKEHLYSTQKDSACTSGLGTILLPNHYKIDVSSVLSFGSFHYPVFNIITSG